MKSLLATLLLVINAAATAQVFDPIAPVGLVVGARTDAAATTPSLDASGCCVLPNSVAIGTIPGVGDLRMTCWLPVPDQNGFVMAVYYINTTSAPVTMFLGSAPMEVEPGGVMTIPGTAPVQLTAERRLVTLVASSKANADRTACGAVVQALVN